MSVVDLSKKRNDLREFITRPLEEEERLSNTYSENIKIIQVKLNERKKKSNQSRPSDQVIEQWIKEEIIKEKRLKLEAYDVDTLVKIYLDAYKGYGILQQLIMDRRYSDVKVIAWDNIWTKGKDGWVKQNLSFNSPDEAEKFIQSVFNRNKSTLNVKFPYNNCIDEEYRLRINGSIGEINPQGAFMVARKQSHYQLTDEQVIKGRTANEEMLALIALFAWLDISYFVFGEQNTGKTTFLANCLDKIPELKSLTTFEDTPEFWLTKKNWHSHVTRPYVGEGFEPVALQDLVFNFFRESGQWGCIGEVRGPETFYALQAASGGNPFSFSVHAPTVQLAWKRLLFLSLAESGMKEETLEAYFKLYFKAVIGMVAEGEYKRVDVISLENDEGNGYMDVWKRIPGENKWDFQTLPNWFIQKAKAANVPETLLKKAGVIE